MPEGKDDKAALVPKFLGVLLMKVFLPNGQGEETQNPDVESGDDLKKNFILESPSVHNGLISQDFSVLKRSSQKSFPASKGRKVGAGLKPAPTPLGAIKDLNFPLFEKGGFRGI
jgi:hypothetical protein